MVASLTTHRISKTPCMLGRDEIDQNQGSMDVGQKTAFQNFSLNFNSDIDENNKCSQHQWR